MSDQAGHTLPVTDDTENPANRTSTRPGKGFRIGEYTGRDTLGHGSMATVYLARDSTGHEVALKIFQEGPGFYRPRRNASSARRRRSKKSRRHPNIMKVYSTGQDGVFHFIVMEPIRSRTFEDVVEAGQLDRDTILAVTEQDRPRPPLCAQPQHRAPRRQTLLQHHDR